MCKKMFCGMFFFIAVAIALVATIWPHKFMAEVIYVTRFFEVMLPVLAVGALLKYLFCCDTDNVCKTDIVKEIKKD